MIFSPMTVADLDEVLEIERRSFPSRERGLFPARAQGAVLQDHSRRARRNPTPLIGYICWWLSRRRFRFSMWPLIRRTDSRGGLAPVALVMQAAATHPVQTVTLEVAARTTPPPLTCYRLVWVVAETGVRRNYYGGAKMRSS